MIKITYRKKVPGLWPDIRTDQTGVALVAALLMAALVSILATALLSRQELEIRRTANTVQSDQSLVLAKSMEEWATILLGRSKEREEMKYLGRALPTTPAAGGQVTGRLEDVQGFFNINNLVLGNDQHQKQSRMQFRRLLASCEMPVDLEQAVTDWLDSDQEQLFPGGAEDGEYLSREIAFRTADRPLITASEIRRIKGFSSEAYEKCLQPLLRALPEATHLNINTASARLLASLSDNLDLRTANLLVKARPKEGYRKVADFLEHEALAGTGIQGNYLTVNSSYFMVHSDTVIGQGRTSLFSLLEKRGGAVRVLRRSLGVF